MDISIIIVNYNTIDLVIKNFNGLLKQKNIDFEVFVTDNNSNDNCVEALRPFQEKITFIQNQENLGYGAAINRVIPQTTGRYLYFLNPDAFLDNDFFLEKMVAYMDTHPQYGIAGVALEDPNSSNVLHACKQYPGYEYLKKPFTGLPGDIAWVIGASQIIRRDVFEKISGFDEEIFLYFEDADICLRVRRAGYEIGFIKDLSVKHFRSGSVRKSQISATKNRFYTGLFTFYRKHYSKEDAIFLINAILKKSQKKRRFYQLESLLCPIEKFRRRVEKHQAIINTAKGHIKLIQAS